MSRKKRRKSKGRATKKTPANFNKGVLKAPSSKVIVRKAKAKPPIPFDFSADYHYNKDVRYEYGFTVLYVGEDNETTSNTFGPSCSMRITNSVLIILRSGEIPTQQQQELIIIPLTSVRKVYALLKM